MELITTPHHKQSKKLPSLLLLPSKCLLFGQLPFLIMEVPHNMFQCLLPTMEVALYMLDISPLHFLLLAMKCLLVYQLLKNMCPLCLYSLPIYSILGHHHYYSSSLISSMEQISALSVFSPLSHNNIPCPHLHLEEYHRQD